MLVRLLERKRKDRLYVFTGDLLHWLRGCGLRGPTMVDSCQSRGDAGSCSASEAGCHSSQILELTTWRIPEELLAFSLLWTPEEAAFNTNHNRK